MEKTDAPSWRFEMSFCLEEIYNCTREEFCERTNTQMSEIVSRLEKECVILRESLLFHSDKYRNGGGVTLPEQRELAQLISAITHKLQAKHDKLIDIALYMKNNKIKNIKIFDRVLTTDEITELYLKEVNCD